MQLVYLYFYIICHRAKKHSAQQDSDKSATAVITGSVGTRARARELSTIITCDGWRPMSNATCVCVFWRCGLSVVSTVRNHTKQIAGIQHCNCAVSSNERCGWLASRLYQGQWVRQPTFKHIVQINLRGQLVGPDGWIDWCVPLTVWSIQVQLQQISLRRHGTHGRIQRISIKMMVIKKRHSEWLSSSNGHAVCMQ